MEARDRLGNAIVFMVIALLWTALLFVGVWLAFGWLVESFGRDVALVVTFALAGVILAIVLWVASSRHTTAIWRSALHYAADTQDASVTALRSMAVVQREEARAYRVREHAQAQIDVMGYRAALSDQRQAQQQEQRGQQLQPTWAMNEEEPAENATHFRRVD